MQTNKCLKCGAENPLKNKTCYNCGANITLLGSFKTIASAGVVLVVLYILFKIFA